MRYHCGKPTVAAMVVVSMPLCFFFFFFIIIISLHADQVESFVTTGGGGHRHTPFIASPPAIGRCMPKTPRRESTSSLSTSSSSSSSSSRPPFLTVGFRNRPRRSIFSSTSSTSTSTSTSIWADPTDDHDDNESETTTITNRKEEEEKEESSSSSSKKSHSKKSDMKTIEDVESELRHHRTMFDERLEKASSAADAELIRREYLGKKGPINAAMGYMRLLSNEEKPRLGATVNRIKSEIEAALSSRRDELEMADLERRMESERIDVTAPGLGSFVGTGHRHPISMTIEKAVDVFTRLGYDTVTACEDSPEIETDYNCFEALNCPKDHPARDMQDTFYLTEDREFLLRTHTSAVQIRQLRKRKPPLRIVSPGRVYRRDDIDATHSLMFHQVEILAVEERGSLDLGQLKGTVEHFLRNMFGPDIQVQFRGSYFPFTTPSMEVDVKFRGEWLEVLGCGMVDPNVLRMAGVDPERYTGFAAGFGVERFAMVIHGITDIREFTKSDARFMEQFPTYYDDGNIAFLDGVPPDVVEDDPRGEYPPEEMCSTWEELRETKLAEPDDESAELSTSSSSSSGEAKGEGELKKAKNVADDDDKKTKTKQQQQQQKQQKGTGSGGGGGGVIDISKLDIRVGVITKAWEHEEADKLFCQEIDIGEDEPRMIASGLRDYYNVDDLVGRRVLVLANLKSRKLVGFPSHGMVLCASGRSSADDDDEDENDDDDEEEERVEFVEPPPEAAIGERITVDGFDGEPATENQLQKKKMLNLIFPDLKTDQDGIACYQGIPLSTGAGGVCRAQNGLPDATVG